MNFGLAHIDTFAWIGAFSSARNTKLLPDTKVIGQLKLLCLSCGNKDGLIHISQRVHRYFRDSDIKHVWHVTQHGHDTHQWKEDLFYFLQHVFKNNNGSSKTGSS